METKIGRERVLTEKGWGCRRALGVAGRGDRARREGRRAVLPAGQHVPILGTAKDLAPLDRGVPGAHDAGRSRKGAGGPDNKGEAPGFFLGAHGCLRRAR